MLNREDAWNRTLLSSLKCLAASVNSGFAALQCPHPAIINIIIFIIISIVFFIIVIIITFINIITLLYIVIVISLLSQQWHIQGA